MCIARTLPIAMSLKSPTTTLSPRADAVGAATTLARTTTAATTIFR
jgi:hypothetical protein